MKTFTIYPDKARALGNVMTNNSNVGDMVGVYSNVITLLDGNSEFDTVDYDNLPFPIFQMGVKEELYDTNLTLNVSADNCFVGDTVTVSATLRDYNNELLDGSIAFFCGNDCITNGNNTGQHVVYANTIDGSVSFIFSFDSMGEYVITALSLETTRHHSGESTQNVIVSKKPITINIAGISDTSTYRQDIPFTISVLCNNNHIEGLEYSMLLDGELFDTGVSSNVGESYTLTNLEPGLHTFSIYYSGNDLYESYSETIEFEDGMLPVVSIAKSGSNLIIDVFYNNNPVSDMEVSAITRLYNNQITLSVITNSSGRATIDMSTAPSGSYTFTVTTPEYNGLVSTTVTKTLTF